MHVTFDILICNNTLNILTTALFGRIFDMQIALSQSVQFSCVKVSFQYIGHSDYFNRPALENCMVTG